MSRLGPAHDEAVSQMYDEDRARGDYRKAETRLMSRAWELNAVWDEASDVERDGLIVLLRQAVTQVKKAANVCDRVRKRGEYSDPPG